MGLFGDFVSKLVSKPDDFEDVAVIQKYLEHSNKIYEQDLIGRKFNEFNNVYDELEAKNLAGIRGYEEYTASFIFQKRVELLQQMFDEYGGLHDLAAGLKYYMLNNNRSYFVNAGMVFGQDEYELNPYEILVNEEKAKRYLSNRMYRKNASEIYGINASNIYGPNGPGKTR